MDTVVGNHHLTMSVGPAQEDVDFHVGTLGLRSVKKTVLFDGKLPIYHLYYANAAGDPSSVLTTFPFRRAGLMGRRGSNQVKVINLAVPTGSLEFWESRLSESGIDADRSVRDGAEMAEFMELGLGATRTSSGGVAEAWEVGDGGYGRNVEIVEEPDTRPGTWRFGEGTVHHVAFDAVDSDRQMELKLHIEGLGYTDVSDVKDRQYFDSCYVRTPAGALFELAVSKPKAWAVDEDPDELGTAFKLPPQFEHRREEIMSKLEDIDAAGGTA